MDSNGETQEKNWFTVTLKSSLRLLSYRYCWCYRGFLGFLSQGMQLKLKQETLLQQSNNCPTAKSSLKVRSEQRHLFYISSDWLAWKSIYLSGFRYLLWRGGQFREREERKHCIGWQRSNDCCCHFVSFYISCGAQRLQIQPALVYCLSPFQIDTFLNDCMTIFAGGYHHKN